MNTVELDAVHATAEILEWVQRGAFLTVRDGDRLNTMTIGWATVGIVWSRPVCTVAVRNSRHTFALMEAAPDFTVSVPTTTHLERQLAYCGSRSGRDGDKFAACHLTTLPARHVRSPIIAMAGVQLECRIVARTALDPERLHADLATLYPKKDYHTLYYGEILACYRTEHE